MCERQPLGRAVGAPSCASRPEVADGRDAGDIVVAVFVE